MVQERPENDKKFGERIQIFGSFVRVRPAKRNAERGETHREAEVESKHGRATQRELRGTADALWSSDGGQTPVNFLSPVDLDLPCQLSTIHQSSVRCALAIIASARASVTLSGHGGHAIH